ncbi:sugar ABC transporter permease [Mesomycoplasma molare]|uniref:Sugar ABC transporter permease n=1 Tax=Mesomycoplasma molare TaxID=171288 RepID=A0ABY5TX28_9BACT|nr:sugar ABC transporter permease [Mesomycoplasma molare]UWD34546.1 sugar ABC transporter permease [Mesomycoplasma molare]
MNKNIKAKVKNLFFFIPFLLFISLFLILPLLKTFYESFIVFAKYKKTSYSFGIENFVKVFNDNNFYISIKNSSFLFFVPTFFSILVSFIFSYNLAKLLIKKKNNLFLRIIYSQFFISNFAIGIAFLILFGEKNLFFKLFNSNKSFLNGNERISILLYYFIFQVWRSLPFNIVIFTFAFLQLNTKYKLPFFQDNLTFKDKFINIYIKEFQKYFKLIFYTNSIFSFLLYPGSILPEEKIEHLEAQTIASYIINLINPINGGIEIDPHKAYAASFIILIYIFFLFSCFYISIKILKKVIYIMREKKWKKL